MRPTGRLHIGHYFGALQNWVKLQKTIRGPMSGVRMFFLYRRLACDDYGLCRYFVRSAQNSIEIATDWLAAGLDPEKSTMFVQSQCRSTPSCTCCFR